MVLAQVSAIQDIFSLTCGPDLGRHINARTNKALFFQFHGELPWDLFHLIISMVPGIDLNISFSTAKWHINIAHLYLIRQTKAFTLSILTSSH